jgi:hypothetical protein
MRRRRRRRSQPSCLSSRKSDILGAIRGHSLNFTDTVEGFIHRVEFARVFGLEMIVENQMKMTSIEDIR